LAGAIQSWAEDNNIRGGALVGLPGTGKTAEFEALCGEYETPGIRMDVAAMQDKHVGESGARLRAAMATILSVAGDEGKNVFLLASSNGLENLPLGLRARFSFAPTFFYDVPSEEEKQQIWKIQVGRHGLMEPKDYPATPGWSGRDIKQACEKAQALGISLKEAADWVIPLCTTEKERVDLMRANAHNKYLSASVPGPYQFNESEMHTEVVLPIDSDGRRIKE
jgi:SpoVK/Ycf46/Vps4 family AAA+-type ATPase